MTATQTAPVPPAAAQPTRHRSLGCIIGLVILGLFIAGVIAVAATAYQALRLGPEARDLREAAREHFATAGSWHPQIELRLGALTCALLREIVIEIADEPDATAVLRAARTVDCGVYQVSAATTARERAEFLHATTATMTDRGWTRTVAVVDGTSTVAVYVPERMPAGGEIECGVVVYDDQVLVVAVVRAKVAPLFELIRRHAGERGGHGIER